MIQSVIILFFPSLKDKWHLVQRGFIWGGHFPWEFTLDVGHVTLVLQPNLIPASAPINIK